MEVEFKPAGAGDEGALVEMMREFNEHEGIRFDERAVRDALGLLLADASLGRVWFIGAGAETLGYLVLTFGFSLEFRGRDAFIDELFVRDEFRGRGLGASAIRFAEGVRRERGVRALHLEVERANTGAQSVYRKAGFKDHDRYLLTKWL